MNNNFENDRQSVEYPYDRNEEKAAHPDTTTYFVLSIIGLALSTILGIPLAGLIVSIIAMNKGKAYSALGGADIGEARAAKIMALLGLIFGIIGTAAVALFLIVYILYIFGIFGLAFIAAGL